MKRAQQKVIKSPAADKLYISREGQQSANSMKFYDIEYLMEDGLIVRPVIQSPELTIPFAPGDFKGNQRFKINLGLADSPSFERLLKAMDKKLAAWAAEYSMDYFNKALSMPVVEATMTSIVKPAQDVSCSTRNLACTGP